MELEHYLNLTLTIIGYLIVTGFGLTVVLFLVVCFLVLISHLFG